MMEMLINLIVVITSQCIHILSHHIVHIKETMLLQHKYIQV